MSSSLFVSAVLLAAGRSTRMGGETPKVLLPLGGESVLRRSAAALLASEVVSELVVVGGAGTLDRLRDDLGPLGSQLGALVEGGAERTDSVRAGVASASKDADVILIHDAARPLVRPERVTEVARTAFDRGAAILAVPVRDTSKTSRDGREVSGTLDRSILWSAQTPQAFDAERLRRVLRRAERDQFTPTDDAGLFERYEGAVVLVEGDEDNLKITTPGDLALGEALLASRKERS